jgi:acyl carrier protein
MNLKDLLTAHIQAALVSDGSNVQVDDETMLLDEGIIDSMGLMDLVMFIEEQTGVRVPDEEVMPDNFQTVPSITAMVHRLRSQRSEV